MIHKVAKSCLGSPSVYCSHLIKEARYRWKLCF